LKGENYRQTKFGGRQYYSFVVLFTFIRCMGVINDNGIYELHKCNTRDKIVNPITNDISNFRREKQQEIYN
jgi:hypothetical protein